VNDDNVDGTQSVTITASALDFLDGDDNLQVTDDDVANESPTLVHPIADQYAQANRPFHFTIHVTPHPASFQNADQPHDVDGTGHVTPRDVLIVIHWLNNQGARPVPDSAPELPDGSLSFVDVNGDDLVSPADALTVVNHLNRPPAIPVTLSQEKSADSAAPRNTAVTQRSFLDAPASRDTAAVDDVFRTAADAADFDRWEDILAPSAGSKMRRS
jgi:hypothetical protein